jgi:hypothetical protein
VSKSEVSEASDNGRVRRRDVPGWLVSKSELSEASDNGRVAVQCDERVKWD